MKSYCCIWIFCTFTVLVMKVHLGEANVVRIEVRADNADITDFSMQVKPIANLTGLPASAIEAPPVQEVAPIEQVDLTATTLAPTFEEDPVSDVPAQLMKVPETETWDISNVQFVNFVQFRDKIEVRKSFYMM